MAVITKKEFKHERFAILEEHHRETTLALSCGEGCPHCPVINRGLCSLPKNHEARHMCSKNSSHRW